MSSSHLGKARLRIPDVQNLKGKGEKIACLSVYDASLARLADEAAVDVLLVGDSLGMVLQGAEHTLSVRMSDMVYHTRCVAAGRCHALLIADMPFMSHTDPAQALKNAARLLSRGGAEGVKIEGGRALCETVSCLVTRGIPVCAHLGLVPQFIHRLGGYRVQGRDEAVASSIREDALLLQEAGAFMLVLECVPSALGAQLAQDLDIPVLGIGAGKDCDGQVLVAYDMLGLSTGGGRYNKVFLDAAFPSPRAALSAYVSAVKTARFPRPEHAFG